MKRRSCARWLSAGVLACGLAAGCQHNQVPDAETMTLLQPPMVSCAPAPARGTVVAQPSAPPRAVAPSPCIQQVAYTTTTPVSPPVADSVPAVVKEDAPPVSAPAKTESRPADPREEAAPCKPVVGITASSSLGHAADYSWLSGQVEYSRLSHGWRLRYASVDEDDLHGGSVTLTENPRLDELKDGQHIRVTGHLQNPADRATAPAYSVDSFEVRAPSE